ncbi:MAG TPA: DNA-3-methyladenine glycosylase [Candidatus Acidoferrales bacterium]|nr:DNA-3-methyladenine glycosylase [Candidatus Acidoferrales bacterium]
MTTTLPIPATTPETATPAAARPTAYPWPFDHRQAIAHLSKADRRLARVIEKSVEFELRIEEAQSPYEALLRAITYQSISGKAAATIFARVKSLGSGAPGANGRCPTPEEILRVRKLALRKAGLSGAKIAAVKDLAQKTIEGVVPTLEDAKKLSDQELVERLVSVRGIGAWTVEMFLIFRLGRPDVLPIHDYGVQKGFALTYGKKEIPKPRELAEFGERWRPFRTVASWYMWRAVDLAGKKAREIKKAPAKTPRKPGKRASSRAPATSSARRKRGSRRRAP